MNTQARNLDTAIDGVRMHDSDRLLAKAHMRDAEALAGALSLVARKTGAAARALVALFARRAK